MRACVRTGISFPCVRMCIFLGWECRYFNIQSKNWLCFKTSPLRHTCSLWLKNGEKGLQNTRIHQQLVFVKMWFQDSRQLSSWKLLRFLLTSFLPPWRTLGNKLCIGKICYNRSVIFNQCAAKNFKRCNTWLCSQGTGFSSLRLSNFKKWQQPTQQ